MRVTIACPEALTHDANQLARCIGLGPDDDRTYGEASWVDGSGNRYAVASAVVGPGFAQAATTPLVEPEWGCDLDAAMRAQYLIIIGEAAAPGSLSAVFDEDAMAALAVLGVSVAPSAV